MKQPDYISLINHVADGDRAAFSKLLTYIIPIMFKYFYRMGANQNDAEDLTQDVALTLWEKAKNYDPEKAKFTSWLYTLCYNKWCDIGRAMKRRADHQKEMIETTSAPTNDKALEHKNMVRNGLAVLNEKQRTILILTYYHGLTNQECAKSLKTTPKAIERHLSKARQTMKDFLQK